MVTLKPAGALTVASSSLSVGGGPSFFFLPPWAPPGAGAQGDPQPIRVLFIGNSYTYVNDLPRMVAALAQAGKQRPLVHERETPGGYSFEKHWMDGRAVAKITGAKWDHVVLQEQSLRP